MKMRSSRSEWSNVDAQSKKRFVCWTKNQKNIYIYIYRSI